MMKKEYIILTEGDANSINTWSNVPYFFSKAIEKNGGIVHRIDISFSKNANIFEKFIAQIYKLYFKIFHMLNKNNDIYGFTRTKFYKCVIDRKIKESIEKYPNANIISMNFSHIGGKYSKDIKSLMFCDWSIKYLIEQQEKRKPGTFEKIAIKRQEEEIDKATYVVSLFPAVKRFMEIELGRKIEYLGNVINSEVVEFNSEELIEKKYKSKRYIFIGRKRYIESIKKVIQTVIEYNINIEIDVIGLNKDDDKLLNQPYVFCHGYLSKNDSEQRKLYYDSIMNAKAIINVTEEWNGMSSIIETMYYNTPIIVMPNENTIETFGENCDFGCYLKKNDCIEIKEALYKIEKCDFKDYKYMCEKAHKLVKDFSWDNYINKIMRLL